MKLDLSIHESFGSHLADGARAAEFRMSRIDPYVSICEEIVLDFTGVRNANSSFTNALVAGLIEQHGSSVLDRLVFKGCNPAIQVLIEAAAALALHKIKGRVDA